MPAKYPLSEIQELVGLQLDEPEEGTVEFPYVNKSTNKVIRAMRAKGKNFSMQQAARYMLNVVYDKLKESNFKQQVAMDLEQNLPADEYLIRDEGIVWYLKLSIRKDPNNNAVLVFSFHPSTCDARTENGDFYPKAEAYL